MNRWNLSSAVVPVTGAASGIGLALCHHLRAAGATPMLLDVDRPKLEAACREVYGDDPQAARHGYVVDVANSASVDAALEAIARAHGRVTHGVANAGITMHTNILDTTDEAWRKVMGVNLDGVMYFSRACARQMVEAQSGAIVCLASIMGFGAKESRIAYAASKGAIINLTRAMAIDLGRHGIRVNAVAPGVIDTPQQLINAPAYRQAQAARAALGRTGKAEDIANVVLFLLSDLSAFVTAQTVVADGGLTARFG